MKYEFRIIEVENLKIGDKINIPEGSLILGEETSSEQGYIYDSNKPDWITRIKIFVPINQ